MKKSVLAEPKPTIEKEKKYEVEEIAVMTSFCIEGLKMIGNNYIEPSAIQWDKRMVMVELIKQEPEIVCAKKELFFVLTILTNYMKCAIGTNYKIPLELSDKLENGVHVVTENYLNECIFYSDTDETAIASIVNILNKVILKTEKMILSKNNDVFHSGSEKTGKIIGETCLAKIVIAKTYLNSILYKID